MPNIVQQTRYKPCSWQNFHIFKWINIKLQSSTYLVHCLWVHLPCNPAPIVFTIIPNKILHNANNLKMQLGFNLYFCKTKCFSLWLVWKSIVVDKNPLNFGLSTETPSSLNPLSSKTEQHQYIIKRKGYEN